MSVPVVAPTATCSTEARAHPINTDRSIRALQKGEDIVKLKNIVNKEEKTHYILNFISDHGQVHMEHSQKESQRKDWYVPKLEQ